MGAPHNKSRYGETWPQTRIDISKCELEKIKPWAIVSGGWAWHFMSPEGHIEYKHAHDHKDIDIFVEPTDVAEIVTCIKQNDFQKVWTRYDKLPSDEEFRRYEKTVDISNKSVRITIDFFVRKDVPYRNIAGWRVVEPSYLLTLYHDIHSSDKCFAVKAATALLIKGIDRMPLPTIYLAG